MAAESKFKKFAETDAGKELTAEELTEMEAAREEILDLSQKEFAKYPYSGWRSSS